MNTLNSFSASDKTTCRDLFCGIFFLGDCKKLSVTYCNCFCFMGVSVVGWFCDSNFWLLKQPIIRSYFGWTLTPQKMEMWWTCEIFLKCVGLRIYIIYTYTVYYTYIYMYICIVYSIIPWKPIDDGVRWRRGLPPKPSCWSKLREIWVVFHGNILWKSWRLFMVVFYILQLKFR